MEAAIETLLELASLEVTKVEKKKQCLEIECRSSSRSASCPSCLHQCYEVRKYHTRTVRDMPIQGRAVYLRIRQRQFHCLECQRYFSEQFEWVEKKQSLTKRFAALLVEKSKNTSIKNVSVQENVLWDVVWRAVKRAAATKAERQATEKKLRSVASG